MRERERERARERICTSFILMDSFNRKTMLLRNQSCKLSAFLSMNSRTWSRQEGTITQWCINQNGENIRTSRFILKKGGIEFRGAEPKKKKRQANRLEILTGKIHSVLYEITCITSNTYKPGTDSNVGFCVLI